jgi:CheY-like chemotaxis protein
MLRVLTPKRMTSGEDLPSGPEIVTEPLSKRVLVAENEALVSMLTVDELVDAGYLVAGPFDSCVDATQWLKSNTPGLAILDHELRDGPCTEVAIELRRRGVPFVALTGSHPEDLPEVLRQSPKLLKPDGLDRLPVILQALLVD